MAFFIEHDENMSQSEVDQRKKLLEDQADCDITFTFSSNEVKESIRGHKEIIAAKSPVFKAMFNALEKDDISEIHIEKVNLAIFQHVLRYLYYGQWDANLDNVVSISYCADKYEIEELRKLCKECVLHYTTLSPVKMLDKAVILGEESMRQICLHRIAIIDGLGHELYISEQSDISKATLELIIKQDTLNSPELNIYKLCIAWAEKECKKQDLEVTMANMREVLGDDITYNIRFSSMASEGLGYLLSKGSILNQGEGNMVARSILGLPQTGRMLENFTFITTSRVKTLLFYFDTFTTSLVKMDDITVDMKLKLDTPKRLSIKSVLLLDPGFDKEAEIAKHKIEEVRIDSNKSKEIIEPYGKDVIHDKWGIVEAVFDPPAELKSGNFTISIGFHGFKSHVGVNPLKLMPGTKQVVPSYITNPDVSQGRDEPFRLYYRSKLAPLVAGITYNLV